MYDPRVGVWLNLDPIGFKAGDTNPNRYVGNSATIFADPSGLLKGHHIVPKELWKGMSDAVTNVFDQDYARIGNKYYDFHDGLSMDGISHVEYTAEVEKMLKKLLGNRDPSRLRVDEAKIFVQRVWDTPNTKIQDFNRGVIVEAHAAFMMGEARYYHNRAKNMGVDEAFEEAKKTTTEVMEKARVELADAVKLRTKRIAGRSVKVIAGALPFAGAAWVLFQTGDANAAGRELALELSGFDFAVDMGQALGLAHDAMLDDAYRAMIATWGRGSRDWMRKAVILDEQDQGNIRRRGINTHGYDIDPYGRFR